MRNTIALCLFVVLAVMTFRSASRLSRGDFSESPLLMALDVRRKPEVIRFYTRLTRMLATLFATIPAAYYLPVRWHFAVQIVFLLVLLGTVACWFLLGPYLFKARPDAEEKKD